MMDGVLKDAGESPGAFTDRPGDPLQGFWVFCSSAVGSRKLDFRFTEVKEARCPI